MGAFTRVCSYDAPPTRSPRVALVPPVAYALLWHHVSLFCSCRRCFGTISRSTCSTSTADTKRAACVSVARQRCSQTPANTVRVHQRVWVCRCAHTLRRVVYACNTFVKRLTECGGYWWCGISAMCTTPPQSAVRVSERSGASSAVCELLIGQTSSQRDADVCRVLRCACEVDVRCVWVVLCW